jgi:FKBP-type peptidyl-prolyl cis-trans isomerase
VRKRRAGIKVFEDIIGMGDKVERQRHYRMSLRMWLNKGDPIIWTRGLGISFSTEILEGGQRLTEEYRVDREILFDGLFYGIDGTRVGGRRLLKISPHMAFRERGVPGIIPPNAVLTVEVTVLEKLPGD